MLKTAPAPDNNELIALLERQLRDAKAGKLASVAVVTVTPQGVISQHSCGNVHPLVIGAAQLQRQLLDVIYPTQGTRLSS